MINYWGHYTEGENSVGNQPGKSQLIIGKAKVIDYQLYSWISYQPCQTIHNWPLKDVQKPESVSVCLPDMYSL